MQMGIDVWVRRTNAPASSRVTEPLTRTLPPVVEAPAVVERSVPVPSAETAVRVRLDCVAVRHAVAIGDFTNPLDKRLAQEIVSVVGGSAAPKIQHTQFRWPATQTGDASVAAARSAYRAFLRGQADRAEARGVLLFGAAACALIEDADAEAAAIVLRCPELATLRADPQAKKALWLSVSKTALV